MNNKLISKLQGLKRGQLWTTSVFTAVILAQLFDAALSWYFYGQFRPSSAFTTLITTLLVATPIAILLSYLLAKLAEAQQETLILLAKNTKDQLNVAMDATHLLLWEFDLFNDTMKFDPSQLHWLDMTAFVPPYTMQGWIQQIHPDDLPVFMAHFQAALLPGDALFDCEYRVAQKSQPWGWLHSKGRIVKRNAEGRPLTAVGTTANINERKRIEMENTEAKERFELIFNTSPNVMLISRLHDGYITQVNETFLRTSGFQKEDVIGNTTLGLNLFSKAEDRQRMVTALTTTGICDNLEIEFQSNNGRRGIGLLSAVITNLHGVPHIVSTVHDITEMKRCEQLIWNQANYDTLTGLPNRQMFHDRLLHELKKAHRAHLPMGLLFIDLDHFKEVNDKLGHAMGDQLLTEAAQRLSSCVRASDTVARLGGDEFTVILAELDEASQIERIAEAILYVLEKPFQLGMELSTISASIGITVYPDDATEAAALIRNADQAMYVAKNAGRNRYCRFTLAVQAAAQDKQNLMSELQNALAAGEFRLYYQPILDLKTACICKAEALLRWHHPRRGIISPAEFLMLIEDMGLMHDIGDWLIREAARQAQQWQQELNTDFQISVNLSPVQLEASNPHGLTAGFALQSAPLIFEIQEKHLLAPSAPSAERLYALRKAGIQLAVDACGGGLAPLTYLKQFDISYLKMDAAFIRNLSTDSSELALSEALIVMAHKLGLQVITQGIETVNQRDFLSRIGSDYGQGYLFSPPIPAEQFAQLFVKAPSMFHRDDNAALPDNAASAFQLAD